jgi:3D (Asp-Asp-Asp) domain-containing protein
MHKFVGLVLASTLLSNSVFVPLVANAQTTLPLVSTSTVNVESMTTAPVSMVQEPATTSLGLPQGTALLSSATSLLASTTPVAIPLTTYSVTLTSYNAVANQTSPTPWITASGAHSNPQVIAARSRGLANALPFGTIIAVMGPSDSGNDGPYCGYDSVSHLIGYRVIADTTNARFIAPRIDVQLSQNDKVDVAGKLTNPSVALGACTGVQIAVVGYVNPQNIPSTQAGLAALVQNSQSLASAQF